MKKSFQYYQDHGHGWIRIPVALIILVGLEDKISNFSYRKGKYAFLEEDCDGPLVMDALSDRGIEFTLVPKHTDNQSQIRSYPRWYKDADFVN